MSAWRRRPLKAPASRSREAHRHEMNDEFDGRATEAPAVAMRGITKRFPGVRRERRRRLRGGGRGGARAARRERRREEHALEHPDRPLPPRRGRARAVRPARRVRRRRATRSTRGSGWCTSTSGSSRRSPSRRTSSSATTATSAARSCSSGGAIESAVAELGEPLRARGRPAARRSGSSRSASSSGSRSSRRSTARRAILILDEPTAVLTPQEAEALFATLRAMAAEGAHRDLHLPQAPRGDGRRRPRHRAPRRALGRRPSTPPA